MMKILLALDGSEPSKAAVDETARQRFADASEVRVVSVVDQSYFSEMFFEESLYGSHCGDRENYMRAGACGSQKSGNTANVAAAVPMLQQNGHAIAAAFPELVRN